MGRIRQRQIISLIWPGVVVLVSRFVATLARSAGRRAQGARMQERFQGRRRTPAHQRKSARAQKFPKAKIGLNFEVEEVSMCGSLSTRPQGASGPTSPSARTPAQTREEQEGKSARAQEGKRARTPAQEHQRKNTSSANARAPAQEHQQRKRRHRAGHLDEVVHPKAVAEGLRRERGVACGWSKPASMGHNSAGGSSGWCPEFGGLGRKCGT